MAPKHVGFDLNTVAGNADDVSKPLSLNVKKVSNDEGPNHSRITCGRDICKEQGIAPYDVSCFKNRLERCYGEVLPPQVKHDICQVFVDHCAQLSLNDQKNSENLTFNIMKLLESLLYSTKQNVVTDKVFDVVNDRALNPQVHFANVYLGKRNIDYVLDTFSPSPPHKFQNRRIICDPGPSRPSLKNTNNVIDVDDSDDDCEIFDGGTLKTPLNLVGKTHSALSNRKFDEKLRRMCKKSNKLLACEQGH